jgi:hypothetical protein
MFQTLPLFTVINLFTTQFQAVGPVNRFLVEGLKDLIQDLTMKLFLARRDHSLPKEKTTFQRKLPSMEIKVRTTLFQPDGQDNRFLVEDLKDQTLALMTKQFSEEKDLSLTKEKNMFQKKHQSMVINHFTIQCQVDGLDSKFQEEDLKGQTLVLMMKQF